MYIFTEKKIEYHIELIAQLFETGRIFQVFVINELVLLQQVSNVLSFIDKDYKLGVIMSVKRY